MVIDSGPESDEVQEVLDSQIQGSVHITQDESSEKPASTHN